MYIDEQILYALARKWPSPVAQRVKKFSALPGSETYEMAYAQNQFSQKVRDGIGVDVTGLDVLEIGCGHGGIACYIALAGAKSVTGIDLSTFALGYTDRYAKQISERFGPGYTLPVKFLLMDAHNLEIDDASFDLIFADNVFEHFDDPLKVLLECKRVLKPGGKIIAPHFSSIYSKYGLHLKHGIKMPWANLFFRESTIVKVMLRLSKDDPELVKIYPGLANNPKNVRDLRKYKDLNGLTFKQFISLFSASGLHIDEFRIHPTSFGRVILHTPILKHSFLMEILSVWASAVISKPDKAKAL